MHDHRTVQTHQRAIHSTTEAAPAFAPNGTESAHEALIQRVCNLTSTDRSVAQHLISEMLHYFSDTPEDFIIRRHRELQQAGFNNTKIYSIVADELKNRCFHCPDMSLRQIRRVIYG